MYLLTRTLNSRFVILWRQQIALADMKIPNFFNRLKYVLRTLYGWTSDSQVQIWSKQKQYHTCKEPNFKF